MTIATREAWLSGWDATPGIVSVWAEPSGHVTVFRRVPETGELVREQARFRPFVVLDSLEWLAPVRGALVRETAETHDGFTYRELEGEGALRYLVRADDGRALSAALLRGASARLGRRVASVRELGSDVALVLPPEEQYLVATGRTYFRDLDFDALHRLQIDLETTGLDPTRDRIFMVAIRDPEGRHHVLEARGAHDRDEAELLARVVEAVRVADPDVIENHHLHGFDLPFLAARARRLRVPLPLSRIEGMGLRERPARRGAALSPDAPRTRARFTIPGRELIDTLDAVLRHDFAARDLPGHGLKEVARHFGLASETRTYVPGARIHATYRQDPERVRRYATDDVDEVASLARLLSGAAFALARMAPRRYERLADAGPATGVIDPMLVRAYLHEGAALPAHEAGDGTPHSGAALHLFATGVAHRVVKADVASLYPSLMRQFHIGPRRDRLGVLLAIVDSLVTRRLEAKDRSKRAPPGSRERHTDEALSAAMKLVVNSAYGYLGAASLTRFADVHAANEVTRRGRETLRTICDELAARSVTLLEADTDGVYFAVPEHFTEADERRVVAEVDALLPELVRLEFEGRYAAMLSHEPKNYALLTYEGALVLRGVAFRSRRAEPFGEDFLRRALACLLRGDVRGAREAYVHTVLSLRRHELPTYAVTTDVRLTKSPAQYEASAKRELVYDALLGAGIRHWNVGRRVRVYRAIGGRAGLLPTEPEAIAHDPRDYDAAYYTRLLERTFATRLSRALGSDTYAALVADPEQLDLFEASLDDATPILTVLA